MTNTHQRIQTRVAEIWCDDGGIIRAVVKPLADVIISDTRTDLQHVLELTGGHPFCVYADVRVVKSIERSAQRFTAQLSEHIVALALRVGPPLSRATGNLFMEVRRPPYPIRLFTSEDKALVWLRGFHDDTPQKKRKFILGGRAIESGHPGRDTF